MAFATVSERLSLRNGPAACDFTVQIITQADREIEIAADDIEHALNLQASWMDRHNAKECEIFRILPDGEINPTIGRVTASEWAAR